MAWTSDDLAAIDVAILRAAKGQSATFHGRSWTSQDLSELRALRAEMAAEIAAAAGRPTTRLAATRKGTN